MALESGLSGMLLPAIKKEKCENGVYELFRKDYYELIRKDTLQKDAVDTIHAMFTQEKIAHVFLKGTFLKTLYPKTFMRSMGDIDILVHDTDMSKIHELLPQKGFLNWINSDSHDCFHLGNQVFVEIHPILETSFDSKYMTFAENPWRYALEVTPHHFQFQDDYHVCYLLYHMIKHLSSSGLGLRNILDIGIFLYKRKPDSVGLLEMTEKFGMTKFFQNMVYLNQLYFDFPGLESYLKDYQIDDSLADEMLDFVITSGIHGRGSEHNQFESKIAKTQLTSKSDTAGRRKATLSLLFPSQSQLAHDYPYVKRSVLLLPIAWVHRAIRRFSKRPKHTLRKLTMLGSSNMDLQKTKQLYQKLGL